jgi:hypothetical protein
MMTDSRSFDPLLTFVRHSWLDFISLQPTICCNVLCRVLKKLMMSGLEKFMVGSYYYLICKIKFHLKAGECLRKITIVYNVYQDVLVLQIFPTKDRFSF